jgi:hypothetical protein
MVESRKKKNFSLPNRAAQVPRFEVENIGFLKKGGHVGHLGQSQQPWAFLASNRPEREVGLRLDGQSRPLSSSQLALNGDFVVNIDRSSRKAKEREVASMVEGPRAAAKHAGLTQAEIDAAGKLVEKALQWRGYPDYSDEELGVLAILAAYHSYQQRARGKKGRESAKEKVEHRRSFVNFFLRSIVEEKYR